MSGLYIEQHGSGPDIVLIHGWGLHSGVWSPVVDALAQCARVTLVDLPGHGRSAPLAGRALSDWSGAVYDAVQGRIESPTTWLGWSLGGLVGLDIARQHSDAVSALVLVDANPRFTATADWPQAMAAKVFENFERGLAEDPAATLNRFIALHAGAGSDRSVIHMLRECVGAHGETDRAALADGLRLLRECDLRDTIRGLQAPLHIIQGREDRMVPAAAAPAIAALKAGTTVHIIEDAGHAPFVSHTDEFVRHVTVALQGISHEHA